MTVLPYTNYQRILRAILLENIVGQGNELQKRRYCPVNEPKQNFDAEKAPKMRFQIFQQSQREFDLLFFKTSEQIKRTKKVEK